MTISVFKDLKIFDVGNKSNVDLICTKINIVDSKVILDLSRCIIDYPATSIIVDKILYTLKDMNGEKELFIITNLNILELLLLHWLFIGSKYFDLNKKDAPQNDSMTLFKKNLTDKLTQDQIKLAIQIVDKSMSIVKEFNYGYKTI